MSRRGIVSNLRVAVAVLLGLGLPMVAAPAGAADAESLERHGIFADSIDVSLVEIEVVVTDRQGRVLTDLARGEFDVAEDGTLVELSSFSAMGNSAALPPDELPVAAGRSIVVLVDNAHLEPIHRKRVLEALRQTVPSLVSEDTRVMVVSKDRVLTVEQRLTGDPAQITVALDRLAGSTDTGGQLAVERSWLLRRIERGVEPTASGGFGGGAAGESGGETAADLIRSEARDILGFVRIYAENARQEVVRTFDLLDRFCAALTGIPGRKVLLYVSDGLPLQPGRIPMAAWNEKYGRIYSDESGVFSSAGRLREVDLSRRLADLVADANAAGVVFYPFDAGGMSVGGVGAGAASASGRGSRLGGVDLSHTEALSGLALGTGGVLSPRGSDVGYLVERMREDVASLYSLGFVSPHPSDGTQRRLEVRVGRPGTRVRHLEGYRAKSPDQRLLDRTMAVLLLDVAENPLAVELEVGEVRATPDETLRVPLLVRIPVSRLVLLPEKTEHLGRLAVYVVAQDAEGRMSRPGLTEVPLRIPNAELLSAMSQTIGYRTNLEVRPGRQKIAVGVRDDVGLVSSTLNLNLELEAP